LSAAVAGGLAARYPTRFLRSYTRSKLRRDPVYGAVAEHVRGTNAPLLDIGCGVGILPAFLRQRGFTAPIRGIDHDERKIAVARTIVPDVTFEAVDARSVRVEGGGTVVMLDVLHYFSDADQERILERVAASATTVIIRDALRDANWRYRATYALEVFARTIRWIRSERLNFPTREAIERLFPGFDEEVVPMWGGLPTNNYLFVFRRSSEGMTKA
jgi:trans-aconitate methyltransferase